MSVKYNSDVAAADIEDLKRKRCYFWTRETLKVRLKQQDRRYAGCILWMYVVKCSTISSSRWLVVTSAADWSSSSHFLPDLLVLLLQAEQTAQILFFFSVSLSEKQNNGRPNASHLQIHKILRQRCCGTEIVSSTAISLYTS